MATRRCARPGCADVACATLAFRYDQQQAWLTPLVQDKTPATYDLCGPCADRTAPPRGWELVDERPDLDGPATAVATSDPVRDAIAAALRGEAPPSTPPPAPAPSLSIVRDVPAPVAPAPASPAPPSPGEFVEADESAARTDAEPEVAAAPAPPPRRNDLDGGLDRAPREVIAVRRRRRRPVEMLIGAAEGGVEGAADAPDVVATSALDPSPAPTAIPAAASASPGGAAATDPAGRSRRRRSHAPVTHALGVAVEPDAVAPAPSSVPPAPAAPAADSVGEVVDERPLDPSRAPSRQASLQSPLESSVDVPAEPARVSASAVVGADEQTALPLAFDTVPEPLVSLAAAPDATSAR